MSWSSLWCCFFAGLLCWPAPARAQEPRLDEANVRRHRIKTVRVLQGSEEYPEDLRVEETYRFGTKGQQLSYSNPGLEKAKSATRSSPDYRTDEVTDALGRVLVSRDYVSDQLLSTRYSEYDERNQAVRTISFGEPFDGEVVGGVSIWLYGYDKQGNQVEVVHVPSLSQNRLYFGPRTLYAYDAQHRPIAHTEFEGLLAPTTSDSTSYNAAGQTTRKVTYHHELRDYPVLVDLQWARYDSRGRFLEGVEASSNRAATPGLNWQRNTIYRYRPDGQLAEVLGSEVTFGRSATAAQALRRTLDTLRLVAGSELQRTTYRYNARGLLVERRTSSSPGRGAYAVVQYLRRWEYEYYR